MTIEKPDGWSVLTVEDSRKDHGTVEAENPEWRKASQDSSEIFAFARYGVPLRAFTTTVRIGSRRAGPAEERSGQRALENIISPARQALADLKVVTPPEIVVLAEREAGHAVLTYSLTANGVLERVGSEMWVIPQGASYLWVGATFPADDMNRSREAISKLVNSIKVPLPPSTDIR